MPRGYSKQKSLDWVQSQYKHVAALADISQRVKGQLTIALAKGEPIDVVEAWQSAVVAMNLDEDALKSLDFDLYFIRQEVIRLGKERDTVGDKVRLCSPTVSKVLRNGWRIIK